MAYSSNDLSRPLPPEPSAEMNWRLGGVDIVRMLRRRLGTILLVVVAGMVLTGFYVARQVPVYAATAAILLRSAEMPSETVNPTPGPEFVSSTQVFTQAQVLRSRHFASLLADRLGLRLDPRFNPALAEPEPPSVLDWLRHALGMADPVPPSEMSPERQNAEVIEALLGLYSIGASEQHNVIEIRVEHPDPVLAAQVANETARLYIDLQLEDQIQDLDRDIHFMRQRSEEIAQSLSQQQVTMADLIQENQLHDDNAAPTLTAERSVLENRLAASPQDPELLDQIAAIDARLQARVSAEIELAEHEIALRAEAGRLDAINKRLDELEAQRETPPRSAVQISVAEPPSMPASPNAASTLAVSFVAFGVLGVVAVLLRESLDSRVLSQEQAESLTGLEVLTSLARLPRSALRRYGAPHLGVAADASPSFSNGIRILVSAAMDGAGPGRAPIVLIGSARPGEGKSSVACSMAVAAAMDDLRVLLIDLDIRRFGSTRYLGMPRGEVTFADALSDPKVLAAAIATTDQPGVDLLSFRPGSNLSRRVLLAKGAQEALAAIRGSYDLVIVDTPPLLASEEAGRLHGIVDKAILVSRWGETDRDTLVQAARIMRRSGLPVIGLAINGVSQRSAPAYGYAAYSDEDYRSREPADA